LAPEPGELALGQGDGIQDGVGTKRSGDFNLKLNFKKKVLITAFGNP
jgi:hypothetical protein